MTKTTTKNRRAVGTLGVAAVIAVLAVSMIVMNFTSPILAEHEPAIAAKKAGVSMMKPTVATAVQVASSSVSVPQELAHFDIKSPNGGDWLVDATIECATATQVKATGKQSKLSGAYAGAKVWFELDRVPISILTGDQVAKGSLGEIPDAATWNLCEQVFEMKSNFNDLIIQCDQEDFEAGLCTEEELGHLVFLCDGETAEDDNNDACSQSLEVFSKNAGTHGAAVMIHDVSAGESHTISLMAILSSGGSSQSTLESTNVDDESDNFVNAGVMIGKRIVVAEPIHMQTVQTGS
jgi:hypothetical protein